MRITNCFRLIFLFYATLLCASHNSFAEQVRKTIELQDNWHFQLEDKSQLITIPHSWNRVGYYNNSFIPSRINSVNKYMGIATYSREFSVSPQRDKQVWLEFDGVSRIAKVYVNEQFVGEHEGPFTRFRFNITKFISSTSTVNTLKVIVDNSKPTAESTTGHILPIAGDFFVAGGIYRSARLVITNDSHFALNDYGSDGIYTKVHSISKDAAILDIESLLKLDSRNTPSHAKFILTDHEDRIVASSLVKLSDGQSIVKTSLSIANPTLWHVKDAYLYTLTSSLLKDGVSVDSVEFPVGLRQAYATKEGYFVNGEKIKIKGVGYHQDSYFNGWASNYEDIERDFSLLLDMGINSIRLSHYPHGENIHKLADESGILLWDEIPLVTFWNYGNELEEQEKRLEKNAIMQLREMIKQNYNHPSVVIWGIANEVDFAKAAPAFIGATPENIGSPIQLLELLQKEASNLDSRQTAIANCCQGVSSMKALALPEVLEVADIIGANRYFGWYFGEVSDLSNNLDALHELNKPVSVSEYGGGGAISLHSDNVNGGKIDAAGFAQPEEYMSFLHEKSWPIINNKPWIMGAWIWNAFDFSTTIRKEGDSKDINTKGLITADRSTLKDSYYYYQANWSTNPVVHITSKRYTHRKYPIINIKAYSNVLNTTLYVNGEKVSTLSTCENMVCEWKNIALNPGSNDIEITGSRDGFKYSDSTQFYLSKNNSRNIKINAGYIISGDNFGSDNFFSGGESKSMDIHASWKTKAKIAEIKSDLPHSVAAHFREGDFRYYIDLAPGLYDVSLIFVEPDIGATVGDRIFDVKINDKKAVHQLDIVQVVGAPHTEYRISQSLVTNSDGLTIQFTPIVGDAVVSAIIISKKEN